MASWFHTLSSQSLFQNADGEVTWIEDMRESLEELVLLLRDEHTVSSYELQSSGLVQTLLNILNNVSGLKDVLYNVQVIFSCPRYLINKISNKYIKFLLLTSNLEHRRFHK